MMKEEMPWVERQVVSGNPMLQCRSESHANGRGRWYVNRAYSVASR